MLSVHYNPSVLYAQNYLSRASNSVVSALEKMSTGFRINRASDDAAGLYVATKMNSQLRGLKQAQNNISNGLSILNMADSALGDITDLLQRVRDLAVQGANSVYSDASRRAMQAEADALIEEVFRVKDSTLFNGMNVFSGGSGVSTISNLSRASWRVNSENTLAEDVLAVSPPPRSSKTGSMSVFSVNSSVSTESVSRLTEEEAIAQGYTVIKTAQELNDIRNNLDADGNITGKYILMNDIDLSSYANWDPIGRFWGILDGNGHVIKNLTINRPDEDNVGLFANTTYAEIKNLGLTNVNVKGNRWVGGLIGYSGNSDIESCYATGNISGNEQIGGLCGICVGNLHNIDVGGISNSYADVNVTGNKNVGGIAGGCVIYSVIKNCLFTGEFTGSENVGGIAGYSLSGKIENCFWLENQDGSTGGSTDGIGDDQGTSSGNSGLTEDEMGNSDNFTDAGWDEDIWDLTGGTPTLKPVPQPPSSGGTTTGTGNIRLQVGANADPAGNAIYIDTAFDLDAFSVDFSDSVTSADSIVTIDNLLDTINTRRAGFGAAMNRLEAVMQANTSSIENLTASKSTIMDADIAEQSAEYVKNQILQQTTSALLSQAQSFQGSIILGLLS